MRAGREIQLDDHADVAVTREAVANVNRNLRRRAHWWLKGRTAGAQGERGKRDRQRERCRCCRENVPRHVVLLSFDAAEEGQRSLAW